MCKNVLENIKPILLSSLQKQIFAKMLRIILLQASRWSCGALSSSPSSILIIFDGEFCVTVHHSLITTNKLEHVYIIANIDNYLCFT